MDLSFGTLEDSTYTATYRHFDSAGDLAISNVTDDGQTYSSSGPHVTGNEKGEVKVRIDGSYANFDTMVRGESIESSSAGLARDQIAYQHSP